MPTGEPSRQNPEEFDPEQTLFFSRRKKSISLLPLIVGCVLVLGSGALIAWALTQSNRKPIDEPIPDVTPKDPYAGRPVLSPGEAKGLENPPLATPAATPRAADAGGAPDAAPSPTVPPAVPADDSKPVRTALPVDVTPAPTVRKALPVTAADGSMPPTPAPAASAAGGANAPMNLDVNDADNAQVRTEVLRRIDLMPGVSQANKDRLYASVDHARRMGRMLTVPFEKGETTVRGADVERLKQQLDSAEIKQLLDDPTMVFVLLGYADQKGSEKINNDISLSRARSVMDALRDKCGVQNVMHSVAMGGSNLFSAQQVEKNRVVEIWAVLP